MLLRALATLRTKAGAAEDKGGGWQTRSSGGSDDEVTLELIEL